MINFSVMENGLKDVVTWKENHLLNHWSINHLVCVGLEHVIKIDLKIAYNMQVDLSKFIMPQRLKLSINVCRDLDLEHLNH
jgi:hypothetical protein